MAIISQGFFTQPASPSAIRLPIVSDLDYLNVYNITQMAANQTTAVGVQYYWQRGFPVGAYIAYLKSNAANAVNLTQYLAAGGPTLINTTINIPGALNNGVAVNGNITEISNATPPVVTLGAGSGSTAGMSPGNIVRLYSTTGADEFGGLDWTVGYNTFSATTFSLDYATAGGDGTAGNFRVIPYNPYFYPRVRYITSITNANPAVVVTSVTHGYQLGQKVMFKIPAIFGMTQLDTLEGTIVAINTATTGAGANSFSVNIDTSQFSAFTFPANGNQPFTPAQVIPDGEDNAYAANNNLNPYVSAYDNVGYYGIQLPAGANAAANAPGGTGGDTVYWVAGKADTVNNIVPVSLYL